MKPQYLTLVFCFGFRMAFSSDKFQHKATLWDIVVSSHYTRIWHNKSDCTFLQIVPKLSGGCIHNFISIYSCMVVLHFDRIFRPCVLSLFGDLRDVSIVTACRPLWHGRHFSCHRTICYHASLEILSFGDTNIIGQNQHEFVHELMGIDDNSSS